jgi:hypothetical protein
MTKVTTYRLAPADADRTHPDPDERRRQVHEEVLRRERWRQWQFSMPRLSYLVFIDFPTHAAAEAGKARLLQELPGMALQIKPYDWII